MVRLAPRNTYPLELHEFFTTTPTCAAATQSSSLETHVTSGTAAPYASCCCHSLCVYAHTHLKVIASTKRVDRASEEMYLQKQAAIWICTCVDGEPTVILWPLRFPVAFPVCLCGDSFIVAWMLSFQCAGYWLSPLFQLWWVCLGVFAPTVHPETAYISSRKT